MGTLIAEKPKIGLYRILITDLIVTIAARWSATWRPAGPAETLKSRTRTFGPRSRGLCRKTRAKHFGMITEFR